LCIFLRLKRKEFLFSDSTLFWEHKKINKISHHDGIKKHTIKCWLAVSFIWTTDKLWEDTITRTQWCMCVECFTLPLAWRATTTKLGKIKCWTCYGGWKKNIFIHSEALQLYLRSRTVTIYCEVFVFFSVEKGILINRDDDYCWIIKEI
jgi:hypothetical protein